LDINVLVALIDEDHSSHIVASDWFNLNYASGWITCPLTQNGCVRILSQTRYPGALSIAAAMERLRAAVSTEHHQFISDDISLLDDSLVDARRLSGYRQLTDVYLLSLAVAHGARLVTLDTHIPLIAVWGASKRHLVVI
jgi:toxin-antitoxin system PIN domain toxin